ncbi:MAG: CT583 family protein [Chlamydiota bacterium]
MPKFNSLLSLRLKSKDKRKVNALAEKTSQGNLSSFSGVFRVEALNEEEKTELESILENFQEEDHDLQKDLHDLMKITSEVKAITNQAVMLHGERIKKAQDLLKPYKDGAFSAWLIATYGNRQTPYNFLQYYVLYTSLPQDLQAKLDSMPRQVVYALASRKTSASEETVDNYKREIIKNYRSGQSKEELMLIIRNAFPLVESDKRGTNGALSAIRILKKVSSLSKQNHFKPSEKQKKVLQTLLEEVKSAIS